MPRKKQGSQQQNVEALRAYTPHPSRVQSIRQWHLDQIGQEQPAVALFAVTVTADGQILTKGLGLDPVHTHIILEHLDEVRASLSAGIDDPGPVPLNSTPAVYAAR